MSAYIAAEPFILEVSESARFLVPVKGVQNRPRRCDGSRRKFKICWSDHQFIAGPPFCNQSKSLTSRPFVPTRFRLRGLNAFMQTQTFKTQHTHLTMTATDFVALLALEKRGSPHKWVYLARLRAIWPEPLPLPIPKQLHHLVLGALNPLLQLVVNAPGDRVALQISLEALSRIFVLKRTQYWQVAEDLQIWENGGVVFLVVVCDVLESGT